MAFSINLFVEIRNVVHLIENTFMLWSILRFPDMSLLVGDIAGVATCLKHAFTLLVLSFIVWSLLFYFLIKRRTTG